MQRLNGLYEKTFGKFPKPLKKKNEKKRTLVDMFGGGFD